MSQSPQGSPLSPHEGTPPTPVQGVSPTHHRSGLAPHRKTAAPSVSDLRHKAEVPMLVVGGLLTTGALILLAVLAVTDSPIPEWGLVAFTALLAPIMAWAVIIRWQYWSKISNGVEVTPEQLPELWKIYENLAAEMGFGPHAFEGSKDSQPRRMRTIPPLYLLNGNGTINAYAAKCRTQVGYVVIYSDLLDMAYQHGDFSGVRFILAHELGHIKCGHVSLWRMFLSPVLSLIRLSPTLTRAQEYTADRTACFYAMEGAESMLVLYAGKNMYQHVSSEAYYASAARHKDGLWLKISNFMSDHAVGFRRMDALHRAQQNGWNVHGKML